MGKRVTKLRCVCFYLTDVLVSSSSFYHWIILMQYSSSLFLSLIVVRWCHLDMKVETSCISPAVLSAGWPVGRRKFSTGMDLQRSVYLLSNYMTGELRLHDAFMAPNIPFLFILNLFVPSSPLMLSAPLSPRHWERRKRLKRPASSTKKQCIVSFSNHTYLL